MKVLYFCMDEQVGGAETHLHALCSRLAGVEKIFVFFDRGNFDLPFWQSFSSFSKVYRCASVPEVAAIIQKEKPDVVQHFHNFVVSQALDQIQFTGQVVEVVHGAIPFVTDVTKTPKHHTTHVVAVGEGCKDFFLKTWPELREKVSVIPNGIDLQRFKPLSLPRPSRKNLEFLHSGRLYEHDKKITKIIDACRALPHRYWDLRLVGEGVDRNMIFNHALSMIPGHVHFCGFSKEPEKFYRDADIYLSRSPSEGFGLSIGEAAASGVALNLFHCGGICQYLTHEEDALISTTDQEFATNLWRLSSSKELRDKLGRNARLAAEKYFSLEKMCAGYLNLYQSLVSKEPKPVEIKPYVEPKIVAVANPNFHGVYHATKAWVGDSNMIDAPPASNVEMVAQRVLNKEPNLLLLGGDSGYLPLVRHLRARKPSLKIMLTWHASFSFYSFAPGDCDIFCNWIDALNDGLIDKIGLVRREQEKVFGDPRYVYLPNRIIEKPIIAKRYWDDGKIHIGMFGSGLQWKNVYGMLAATKLVPNSVVHTNSASETLKRFAHSLSVDLRVHGHLPHSQFLVLLASMHCNLLLSFTEPSNLTYRESYRLGVPCLVSSVVKIFEAGNPHECDDVDNPTKVAETIVRMLKDPKVDDVNGWLDQQRDENELLIKKVFEEML